MNNIGANSDYGIEEIPETNELIKPVRNILLYAKKYTDNMVFKMIIEKNLPDTSE